MPRPVILGNGSLTVGISEHGLVHDFYYPYVGLDNLTTSRSVHHKVGVWVDGQFSWVDSGWGINVDFRDDALISSIRMQNYELEIELLFTDFVDPRSNVFCRRITLFNKGTQRREIRLFLHQVFQISRAGRADTAMFVPDDNYILDYKGRCSLLIYAQDENGDPYDQYAIGNYGIEGKEGTFIDAEDGELSCSPIEHGGVDSVIRFTTNLGPTQSAEYDYWIVAADSQYAAEKIHEAVKQEGLDKMIDRTRQYWNDWLAVSDEARQNVRPEYQSVLRKSMMVIKAHTDRRGGIIASADSSIYNFGRDYYSYVWPRDGAFALWPLIRLGYTDEPRKFFEFCRDTITEDGYMMHKYQPDRAIGSTWLPMINNNRKELPIQEDETAVVIFMLGEYLRHSNDEDFVRNLYDTLIQPAADFMASFIDESTGLPHASYDLWEERFATHTYTVAVVYQALLAASEFATKFEYADDAVHWRDAAEGILSHSKVLFDPDRKIFRKSILLQQDKSLQFDSTLDISSLYGVMMFGLYRSGGAIDALRDTATAIEAILLDKTPSGGLPRYEHDHYFEVDPRCMGNPWIVTTLWMAQYYARTWQGKKAYKYIDWVLEHAQASGIIAEQIDPNTGMSISVSPLVWSHAELINTILDVAQTN